MADDVKKWDLNVFKRFLLENFTAEELTDVIIEYMQPNDIREVMNDYGYSETFYASAKKSKMKKSKDSVMYLIDDLLDITSRIRKELEDDAVITDHTYNLLQNLDKTISVLNSNIESIYYVQKSTKKSKSFNDMVNNIRKQRKG